MAIAAKDAQRDWLRGNISIVARMEMRRWKCVETVGRRSSKLLGSWEKFVVAERSSWFMAELRSLSAMTTT
jgi:hypothetical protein